MDYKVLIACAGTGSRVRAVSGNSNKALLSVGGRPVIEWIINNTADEVPLVIALGYDGEILREFIDFHFESRDIQYVYIDPFEGPGSGLATTLQQCSRYLQCPFVFHPNDTILDCKMPAPLSNYVVGSEFNEAITHIDYRKILLNENGKFQKIGEKHNTNEAQAALYSGVCGVSDYERFWEGISLSEQNLGEVSGINYLNPNSVKVHFLHWYDTGNPRALTDTRVKKMIDHNILSKLDEDIWFLNEAVVKFFRDDIIASNRVKRAALLKGYVPELMAASDHFYKYTKVEGRVISNIIDDQLFEELLEWLRDFWMLPVQNNFPPLHEKRLCEIFYKDKTYDRASQFLEKYPELECGFFVNDLKVCSFWSSLENLDWRSLCEGVFTRYHGDLHFENILYCDDRRRFTLLDWRQDFAGNLELGDIYYDFSKLLHGMLVSHSAVVDGQFSIEIYADTSLANINIETSPAMERVIPFFLRWVEANGFSVAKVVVLTGLIFINIATLHHSNYDKFLFMLGRLIIENPREFIAKYYVLNY